MNSHPGFFSVERFEDSTATLQGLLVSRVFRLSVQYPAKAGVLDLTHVIRSVVTDSGVQRGSVHIQTLHTTTSLFVNEFQGALLRDYEALLLQLVPEGFAWRHNDPEHSDCDRHNATSHLRSILFGSAAISLQVEDGATVLGRHQRILLGEFDGNQPRTIQVLVMGC